MDAKKKRNPMNIKQFTVHKPGELIAIDTVRGESHAFLPHLLPPAWEWPSELWPLLLEAHTELARLDGIGRHLPNPSLLLRPLQNREAKLSSQLEGTYTNPQQQMLFELEPVSPQSADDPANAHREVANYSTALRDGLLMIRSGMPFSNTLVCELHSILLAGVRGSDSNPGTYRTRQVQIGRPARFVPPPAFYLAERMDNLLNHARRDERLVDPLVDPFIMHYQFEAIHPFEDGNGRVGRLLLALMITKWCGLANQWLFMSAYFESNRDAYIDWLLRISTHGDWSGWVRFCLEGVIVQAEDTAQRCSALLELHASYKERLRIQGGNLRLQGIVDDLFVNPVVQISSLSKAQDVTYHTARKDIQRLVEADILHELAGASQKTYFAPEILDITYES